VQEEVQAIVAGIDQLVSDITQFREDAAAEIARIAQTANQIDERLDTTQQNLAALDRELLAAQVRANNFKERFPLWATVTAIFSTAVLLWVSYAMVRFTGAYWRQWQAPKLAATTRKSLAADESPPQAVTEAPEKSSREPSDEKVDAQVVEPPDEPLDEPREKPLDEEA
jgi:hypothetical protein